MDAWVIALLSMPADYIVGWGFGRAGAWLWKCSKAQWTSNAKPRRRRPATVAMAFQLELQRQMYEMYALEAKSKSTAEEHRRVNPCFGYMAYDSKGKVISRHVDYGSAWRALPSSGGTIKMTTAMANGRI